MTTEAWLLPVAVVVLGALPLVVALRRAHDDVADAVRSFEDFRSALRPAVVELRHDAAVTRERYARLRRGHPHA